MIDEVVSSVDDHRLYPEARGRCAKEPAMLAVLTSATLLATSCVPGDEFHPALCASGLPPITNLRIDQHGIRLWQSPDEPPCRTFRVSRRDIRRFLRYAGQADPHDVHMTLPESACAARGRVRFADGSSGRWQVDRFALGWLDRGGHARVTLYCRRCTTRPWLQ
jgi:hypothetical protein